MRTKNRNIITIIVIILTVILMGLLVISSNSDKKKVAKLTSDREKMTEANESKIYNINVFSDDNNKFSDEDILVSSDEFMDKCKVITYNGNKNASVRYTADLNVSKEDTLILYFKAYSDEISAKLNVKVGDHFEMEYPVTTDVTEYYIPVSGYSKISSIRMDIITDATSLNIGDIYLINYSDTKITSLKTGMFNADDYDEIEMTADDGIEIGKATAAISDGKYLYSFADDNMYVYDTTNNDNKIDTISGIGKVIDVQLCNEGKTLAVVSKEEGIYFVDISDVNNIEIISNYNTLEAATGIEICDEYAFICERYFGTEIVNISDTANPKHVSIISSEKENINCAVSGKYLYIGCWSQKSIDIYDISNLHNTEYISSISTDGNVYGMYISGDNLFVATGYNAAKNNSEITDCGYGMGNGMEIYDISNPESVKWISSSKIDGRYYDTNSGEPTWEVYVSENIAYLTNNLNGVYVYNVENVYTPKRIAHYEAQVFEDDENAEERADYDKTKYIYPYKSNAYYNDSITDVVVIDNNIYMCGYENDVYKIEADYARFSSNLKTGEFSESNNETTEISIKGYNTQVYECDGAVYAAAVYDDCIYAACGTDGIHVLDEELNLLNKVETNGAVRDIVVQDGYLYTAQSTEGIVIYKIGDENNIEEVGQYKISDGVKGSCSDIEVSSDSKLLVAQFGWKSIKLLNVSDVKNPVLSDEIDKDILGSTYYRNICVGNVADKYIGVFGSKSIEWVQSESDSTSNVNITENPFYEEVQGMTAYNDYVIATCDSGYVYYDPTKDSADQLNVVSLSKTKFSGKVTAKDDIMVVSNVKTNMVYILNISNINEPELVSVFKTPESPDVATIGEDCILIPIKYSGLLKLSK